MKMTTKKRFQWFALFVMILFLMTTAAVVMAGTYFSPSKDIMCDAEAGSWCENGFGIQAGSSGIGACIPDQVGFIGWDMSNIGDEISSAQLTLTTYDVSGVPPGGTITFELFVPSTQDWTEDGSQPSPGGAGTAIASTSVALANGTAPQNVVFGGNADPADADALGVYFESLRASGVATVGVRISSGCSLGTLVAFNDREDSGELPGGADATEPDLIFFTPTAVSLGSINAVGQVQNGAGVALFIAALLLLGTGTVVYYRRRQNDMP
jgi:hypothetical protein